MFSNKYRFQSITGLVFLFFGIVVITSAIFITPTFVTNHLTSDHHLSLDGIKQLNNYRYIACLGGILVIICGSILMVYRNFETKLLPIMKFFHFETLHEKRFDRKELVSIAVFIGFIAIGAFALMWWITPYGSGVDPDSIAYIGDAQSFLAGKIFYPIDIHFPPLYPLFLAATSLLEKNLIQAARLLNAILFGINAGLIGVAVYLTAGRSFLATICSVSFFLASAPLLEQHGWALSEPLFIAFLLAGCIFLRLYVYTPKFALLAASSLFLGSALVTRYVGIALLPAALLIVFASGRENNFGRNFVNSLVYLGLACTPLAIVFARNLVVSAKFTDRIFTIHPMNVGNFLRELGGASISFITPGSLPVGIRVAYWGLIAALLATGIIILFKRHSIVPGWRSMELMMPAFCLFLSICYLLFMYITISFFDASTPVNMRLLSPIFCILIVGVFSAMWSLSQTPKSPAVWWGFLICATLAIILKSPDAIRSATTMQENGLGYTSRQWQNSENLAFTRLLPKGTKIYSNGSDVIKFLIERPALNLPKSTNPVTMKTNSLNVKEIEGMCKDVLNKKAVLVYFKTINRYYLPTQTEIESTCKLPVLRTSEDGTVFGDIPVE